MAYGTTDGDRGREPELPGAPRVTVEHERVGDQVAARVVEAVGRTTGPRAPRVDAQTVASLGGWRSVLVHQRRDHAELDRLLARCRSTDGAEQEEALRATYRLVFPHAFTEESVLWPYLRRVLADGDALTVLNEGEHQQVNQMGVELEQVRRGSAEWQARFDRFAEALQLDVHEEEEVLLPRLQTVADPAALRRLGVTWQLVRAVAPTRPHPTLSRRPPGNVLGGLALSPVDRARDRLEHLAARGPAWLRQPSRAVSRHLATLAGVVERSWPARWGEAPQTARSPRLAD